MHNMRFLGFFFLVAFVVGMIAAPRAFTAEESNALPKGVSDVVEKSVAACDKAKAQYDAEVAKQREIILARLRAEEQKAVAAGDLPGIARIQQVVVAVGGDPSTWENTLQKAGAAGAVATGQVKFSGVVYNPGLVARVYRKRVAEWKDPSLRSPFVFLLKSGADWNAADTLLLEKVRGLYEDWDPRVTANGFIVLERDVAVQIKAVNAVIKIDGKVVTENGNWEGTQSFEYKLNKGVHAIDACHMNWMTKRFALNVNKPDSPENILFHIPKALAAEVAAPVKINTNTLPSELILIP